MIELRCAFLIEEAAFGKRLLGCLSDLPVKTYRTTDLPELQSLSRKRAFDFFIWVTEDPGKKQAAVERLLSDLPYLFSCLFCSRIPQKTLFDFTWTFSDFSSETKLKIFITNLHRLALRLKTGKELSSLVLHDLRTPLQNLSSYAEMLISGTFGELNEGQLKILQTMNAQTELADELTQELTLLLRMRKKEFFISKQKTDFSRLIQETLRAVWIWADRKNIKLQAHVEHDLPKVFIDPLAIRRVLFNLLLNALKFSPTNGTVRLMATFEPVKSGTSKIHVRITDSGPGIAVEYLDAIFDPYFRLQNKETAIKGQGLGLYIAKLFVQAHQGNIGVYNNREGGATFYFTLPVESG